LLRSSADDDTIPSFSCVLNHAPGDSEYGLAIDKVKLGGIYRSFVASA
jgi:hypothetical protein